MVPLFTTASFTGPATTLMVAGVILNSVSWTSTGAAAVDEELLLDPESLVTTTTTPMAARRNAPTDISAANTLNVLRSPSLDRCRGLAMAAPRDAVRPAPG